MQNISQLSVKKLNPDIGETIFSFPDGSVIYNRKSKTLCRLDGLLSEIFTFYLDHPSGLSDADIIKLKCGNSASENILADVQQALSGLKSKNIIIVNEDL